ncbi:DUF4160 domain-containing protein [Oricola thermophila]|uniref:DUF4160 domain-containing protein n=1 Tax=Oricola thermophila TaxID=2742145 RepID=A0A6N1VD24_9HYPH|nr:DUF4160 domain-containing protein [Oricola thermophila]QKV18800.1 DUF4160 domain-containing protein [Oricola thermophila]
MPTISIFFGIVIQMYWRDHNPPHLHALYQGREALFDIQTGEVIGGSLPDRAERIVSEWIAQRRPAFAGKLGAWQSSSALQPGAGSRC